jgi:hypothetical protein
LKASREATQMQFLRTRSFFHSFSFEGAILQNVFLENWIAKL